MANQAMSESRDLMVGAGEFYFRRSDDANGLHHLGNVEEFNITTDVTTVEKNSSMNKRRELMASVVTAVTPTATLTLNEYNPYNLALGLFGTEAFYNQEGNNIVDKPLEVLSVPGIIELKNADGKPIYNATNIVVKPAMATPSSWSFGVDGTVTTADGGTLTVTGTYSGATDKTIYVKITSDNIDADDLTGVGFKHSDNIVAIDSAPQNDLTGGSNSETVSIGEGLSIKFELPDSSANIKQSGTLYQIVCVASSSAYKEGVDYLVEEQSSKAGLIKILAGGKIKKGDTVVVNADVPEATICTVSGGNAGEIAGELLFVGDPNIGDAYVIHGWNVRVQPSGDLSGLISEDFGSFQLEIKFLSDYANHPDSPFYKVVKVGEGSGTDVASGEYDPTN